MTQTIEIDTRNYDSLKNGPILSRRQVFSGGFLIEETVTVAYRPQGLWIRRPGPIENGERTTIDEFIPDPPIVRERSSRSSY